MPKLKTHKGIKKVTNKRQSGSITLNPKGKLHMTGKKPNSFNRKKRKNIALSKADHNRLKNVI